MCSMQFFDRFTRMQGQGQFVWDKSHKFRIEGHGLVSTTSEWMGWWIGKEDDIPPNNFFLSQFKLNLDTGYVEATG